MTVDLATLGLGVDSSQVVKANDNLDDLAKTAAKTEKATKGFEGEAQKAARATDRLAQTASRADGIMARLGISARGVAGALTGIVTSLGIGASFAQATRSALEFDAALREVSTLFPVLEGQTEAIESAARRMAKAFGTDATQQVRGFYQAISAGASSVSQATDILDTANRVAIGGITDVTTAVDVLTTATNAYAATGLTAAQAGDALFVAMRAGKTTISELASSLGNVIPIAASLGVSFDEVAASVAALTTQGQSTAQAVTGVRAILAAVARPTTQAARAAQALGIEFSVAALRTKGLSGFLDDVIRRTGGSADAMAQLFGSVEALNAALSFAGGGGATFTAILADMESKAGSVDEAFNRVAGGLRQRLNVILSAIGDRLLGIGTLILTALIPALELLVQNGTTIERVLISVGAGMAVAFGPAILGMVTTLALAIGTTLVGAVNLLTAAIMRNPFGALAVAITTLIVAAYQFRDEIGQVIGVDLPEIARGAANRLIGLFDGAFRSIRDIFIALPRVVGENVIRAVNTIIGAIEGMIQKVANAIDLLAAPVNWMQRQAGLEEMGFLGEVRLGRVPNPFAGAGLNVVASVARNFRDTMRTDYIAPFGEAEEATRTASDALTDLATATAGANDNIAGIGGAAGGAAAKLNEFERAVQGVERRIQEYRLEAETIGMTAMEVDRARVAFDLLHAAKQAGLPITGDLTERVNGLARAYAEAAQTAREAQEQQQFMQQISGQVSSGLADMFMGIVTGAGNAKQAIGQLLQSLGRLLINRAFSALLGGMGGGGGLFGALFGGGFADGAAFAGGRVIPFARGGVVSGATMFPMAGGRTGVMGEAGAEAIMPLARGPDGKLGVKAQGGASAQPQKVELVVKVEGARGNAEVMSMVQAGVGQALKAYDRQLPGRLQTIQKRQG